MLTDVFVCESDSQTKTSVAAADQPGLYGEQAATPVYAGEMVLKTKTRPAPDLPQAPRTKFSVATPVPECSRQIHLAPRAPDSDVGAEL